MELNEIKEQIEKTFANRFRSQGELDVFCQTVMDYIVNIDGYINLDFYDVLNTLEKTDIVEIGTTIGNPDDLIAMLDELHDPMQEKHSDLVQSTLLLQIQFDKTSGLQIDKLDGLTRFLDKISEDIDVIWGVGFDNTLGQDIRITLIEGYKNK